MTRLFRLFTTILFFAACASGLQAATVTGLFNTGVDDLGNPLADGATDTHYFIQETTSNAVKINDASIPGTWLANSGPSRWIWETATGQPTNVTRSFDLVIGLSGFDASTFSLFGRWSTDNNGLDILVNNVSSGATCGGFSAWCDFSLNSGFVNGANTITFIVRDVGAISGFRAEFDRFEGDPETPEVPVPASLPLMLGALGLLGFSARKRRLRT